MSQIEKKRKLLKRRHLRIRKKAVGTAERPRLAVFRSLRHIYAQVIDDASGRTLVSASTQEGEIGKQYGGNAKAAAAVGKALAEKAKAASIVAVVFDRGGRKFHGRIKALADAAREGGLQF